MSGEAILPQLAARAGIAIGAPILMTVIVAALLNIGITDVPTTESAPDRLQGSEALTERLATSIAFRAGLLRIATAEEREFLNAREDPERQTGVIWVAALGGGAGCSLSDAATAIVATESYLRPIWRRKLEQEIGTSMALLVGWQPDWSYGPAQIKPSSARDLMAQAADRLAVRTGAPPGLPPVTPTPDWLSDCSGLSIVDLALVLNGGEEVPLRSHALRHVGGKRIPTMPGVVTYEGVVTQLGSVLSAARGTMLRLISDPEVKDEGGGQYDFGPLPSLSTSDWQDVLPLACLRFRNPQSSSADALAFALDSASEGPTGIAGRAELRAAELLVPAHYLPVADAVPYPEDLTLALALANASDLFLSQALSRQDGRAPEPPIKPMIRPLPDVGATNDLAAETGCDGLLVAPRLQSGSMSP